MMGQRDGIEEDKVACTQETPKGLYGHTTNGKGLGAGEVREI